MSGRTRWGGRKGKEVGLRKRGRGRECKVVKTNTLSVVLLPLNNGREGRPGAGCYAWNVK